MALRVCLVAVPDVMLSTLSGIFDALNAFSLPGISTADTESGVPFEVQIVSQDVGEQTSASGISFSGACSIDEVSECDIVIIPSMMVAGGHWRTRRYEPTVHWLSAMHSSGALLCSACSGVLLLAETGLLDHQQATIHWAYGETFRRNFPKVDLRVDKVLVTSGHRKEFVMSGASASWHDLVLHLVARYVGPGAAQSIAKFMLLEWHRDGQSPYISFRPAVDHGDAVILDSQEWLARSIRVSSPVEEAVRRSGLPERSFKRRFSKATGLTPIQYVQLLRTEEAKRLLETTQDTVEAVCLAVGYEDPSFFRRLFKRHVGLTPGSYRRKFHVRVFSGMI